MVSGGNSSQHFLGALLKLSTILALPYSQGLPHNGSQGYQQQPVTKGRNPSNPNAVLSIPFSHKP
jgi:hypothetical protein